MEIMAHPFYDELRNSDLMQNGKYIVPNLTNLILVERKYQ